MMTAMSGKFLPSPNPAELAENGPNRYLNITDHRRYEKKESKSFNVKIIHITRKKTKYLRNWYQNYENWSRNRKVIKV